MATPGSMLTVETALEFEDRFGEEVYVVIGERSAAYSEWLNKEEVAALKGWLEKWLEASQ
jgi:hypothetical protein